MNLEHIRSLLLQLPHTTETMQWGETLVFWVGSKAAGGRMFALLALDVPADSGRTLCSFAAGPEAFAELCEREAVRPAPYLARAFWVGVLRWDAFTPAEWRTLLTRAHALVFARLPKRTQAALSQPAQTRCRSASPRRTRAGSTNSL